MRFKLYKPTDIPSELLCAVIMLAALFGNLSPRMGLLGNCIGLFFAAIVMLDCVKEKKIRLIVWVLFAGSLVLGVYNVMFVGQHAFQKYVITGVAELPAVAVCFCGVDGFHYVQLAEVA